MKWHCLADCVRNGKTNYEDSTFDIINMIFLIISVHFTTPHWCSVVDSFFFFFLSIFHLNVWKITATTWLMHWEHKSAWMHFAAIGLLHAMYVFVFVRCGLKFSQKELFGMLNNAKQWHFFKSAFPIDHIRANFLFFFRFFDLIWFVHAHCNSTIDRDIFLSKLSNCKPWFSYHIRTHWFTYNWFERMLKSHPDRIW